MKAALVVGRANCVWDDLDQAASLRPDGQRYVIIAVNGVGCDLPRVDHWVSFHPELMVHWVKGRRDKGYADGYQLWTSSNGRRMTDWERSMKLKMVDCKGGSSGMIGVQVALELGMDKIVLAGIPLENKFGHYDEPREWDEADMHRKAWEALPIDVKRKIRSLSGWTRQHFGAATWTWLVDK